jgi:hypothetical protein
MPETKAPEFDFDALMAAAVQRLLKLDQPEAALALAEAKIVRLLGRNSWRDVEVHLTVPGDHYDTLTAPSVYENDAEVNDFGEPYEVRGSSRLCRVFSDVLPPRSDCELVEVKVENEPVPETWREEFKASIGRGAVNQGNVPGVPQAKFVSADGLRYRSKTEMVIADELKRRQIIFFPLPVAVIGGKAVREPDFVILHEGRFGVLEIHGEPWHPASRAAQENAQAYPYRAAGAIHFIADAKDAYNAPGVVIDKLLALMRGPRR